MRSSLFVVGLTLTVLGVSSGRAESPDGPVHHVRNGPYCQAEAAALTAWHNQSPQDAHEMDYFNRMLSAPDDSLRLIMSQESTWQRDKSFFSDAGRLREAAALVDQKAHRYPQQAAPYAWQACIARHLAAKLEGK